MTSILPNLDTLTRIDAAPTVRTALAVEKLALLLPVAEVVKSPDVRPDGAAIRRYREDIAATPTSPQQGGPASGASRESLSTAARTILDLLEHTEAAPVRGATPLLVMLPRQADGMLALRAAIEGSGLFYESHLKAWADGARDLARLRQEPQGALPGRELPGMPAARAAATVSGGVAGAPAGNLATAPGRFDGAQWAALRNGAGGDAAISPAGGAAAGQIAGPATGPASGPHDPGQATLAYRAMSGPEAAIVAHTRADAAPPASTTASTTASTSADASGPSTGPATPANPSAPHALAQPPGPAVHPDAAALVRAQLEALASGQVQWQGEAWPGADLHWTIRHEPADGAGEVPDAWSTRLLLDLPALGPVEATLRLVPAGLDVRLRAAQDGAAAHLLANGHTFANSLAAAGLALTGLKVLAGLPVDTDADALSP